MADVLSVDFAEPFAAIFAWEVVFHVRRAEHVGFFEAVYDGLYRGAAAALAGRMGGNIRSFFLPARKVMEVMTFVGRDDALPGLTWQMKSCR